MKIQADAYSGVYQVKKFGKKTLILSAEIFRLNLKDCQNDEILGAELTKKEFLAIDKEYGIYKIL